MAAMIKESNRDTIVAISTPPGEGGIGVVRLSGREAISVADKIFIAKNGGKIKDQKSFTVRYGRVVSFHEPSRMIDEALLLVMRAPKSYTCEDMVEISVHGGAGVLEAVVESAVRAGARMAGAGEFTKRAFLNGRLDLLQAEAVLDLIQAKTELTRRSAASQLEGALTAKVRAVQGQLVEILSHLEAAIDFPEEGIQPEPLSAVQNRLREISEELKELLAASQTGILAKRGLKVVIAGRPNVGKSSLMNGLTHSPRVIVTPYPGTTRDVVEETIQLRGFPVHLSDTAGIQDTDHPIEKEGIERSKKALEQADLVLFVLDGSRPLSTEDRALFEILPEKTKRIFVINKSDLVKKINEVDLKTLFPNMSVVETSCVREKGLESLEEEIFRSITGGVQLTGEQIMISSLRQKDLLEKTLESVNGAREACQSGLSAEFCAADIRAALENLGGLVGDVAADDVLEVLFSRFCIGK